MGLSALEMLVMRGSIADFVQLSKEEGCVGRLKMAVSRDMVTELAENESDSYVTCIRKRPKGMEDATDDSSVETDCVQNSITDPGQSHYTEYEFDVTKYAQMDIYIKQSLLLQFMVQRDMQSMAEADISSLLGSRFLLKWMSKKGRSMGWCLWLKHIFHLVVTVILLVGMVKSGGDVKNTPLDRQLLQFYLDALRNTADEHLNSNATLTESSCCPLVVEALDRFNIPSCAYTAMVKVKQLCKLSDELLLRYSLPSHRPSIPALHGHIILHQITYFLILYVVVDFVQRSLFLGRNLFGKQSVRAGVTVVFSRLLPGSYVDAGLNLAMYSLFGFVLYIMVEHRGFESVYRWYGNCIYLQKRIDDVIEKQAMAEGYGDIGSHIFVACLILRFILAIHAMRLFPKIGFFIYTSKRMAIHLLQFSIVYGIITAIFALVFHFVMRDEECPVNKREEFQTITSSIFVVYTLSIGGDNNNVFVETSNVNAKMAYTAYTIITVVLLLNLIIAIMTTTAEAINQQPWKQALVSMEMWNEILGVEAVFLSLYSPIVCVKNLIHKRRKMKGSHPRADRITISVVYKSWSKQA